jgi:uncharacterized protein YndB with AHSA1/START domain
MTAKESIGSQSELVVRKSIVVGAPRAHVFRVFTESFGLWWPLKTHHIGAQPAKTSVLEPRVGGRCYEVGIDGTECEWGRVSVWEPPQRLILSWEIDSEWHHDVKMATTVEVRFLAESPESTRVELEHRDLDRFGDKAGMMKSIFESEGGWIGILQGFAVTAESRPQGQEDQQ